MAKNNKGFFISVYIRIMAKKMTMVFTFYISVDITIQIDNRKISNKEIILNYYLTEQDLFARKVNIIISFI